MKTSNIILLSAAVIILGVIVWPRTPKMGTPAPVVTQEDSIKGCYVATIAKDVYTLKIDAQTGTAVSGTLAYKNFEKDSSTGTFTGTYEGNLLRADYTFNSEGMQSVREVAFRKTAEGFIQGFGAVKQDGNKESFVDLADLSYANSPTFAAGACE